MLPRTGDCGVIFLVERKLKRKRSYRFEWLSQRCRCFSCPVKTCAERRRRTAPFLYFSPVKRIIMRKWMKIEWKMKGDLKGESNQNRLWYRPDEWTFHKRDLKRTRCYEKPITLVRGVHSTKQESEDRPIRICQYREEVDGPSQKHDTRITHNKQRPCPFLLWLLYLDIKLERLAGEEPNGDIASSRRQ